MGEVLEEFERQLDQWKRVYAGRPDQEMLRLFLLALEREQLVAVGYRETLIARRLDIMPLSDEVREIIRHALLWTWKDEEMHAIYIRGVLLRLGGLSLRLGTFAQQAIGGVAGWAASARHHLRFSQAPLTRTAATLVAFAGLLAGRVPRAVRGTLQYGPLRRLCAFNIEAELTASRCWSRLVELAAVQADSQPNLVDEFERMKADEDRHARVFEVLHATLDDQDHLVTGESADSIAKRIGEIGEFFLPPERRRSSDNSVGRGGTVWVLQGTAGADKVSVLEQLLDACDLAKQLADKARALGKPTRELRVAVKPTFMIGPSTPASRKRRGVEEKGLTNNGRQAHLMSVADERLEREEACQVRP